MIKSQYSLTKILGNNYSFWFGPGFWAFWIINTPSLKVLYYSPVVNLIGLIGLYGSYLVYTSKIYTDKVRLACISIISLFWAILLISGVLGTDAAVDFSLIFRYVSVYLALIAITFCINKKDIPATIGWQILWGTALSLYQVVYQFSFSNLEDSIHYNTVAIPMSSSLIAILGIFFFTREKLKDKLTIVFMWVCSIFNLLGITSLSGRGPLIYAIVVMLLMGCFKLNYSKIFKPQKIANLLKLMIAVLILGYLAYINIKSRLEDWQIDRYIQIYSNIEQEPRIKLYQSAIDAIAENPLGYGLNGSDNIIGFYPHNIFLEILLSGGIIALIPFAIFVVWYFIKLRQAVTSGAANVPIAMVSCYLFLTWNTSFDLASSYVCIGSMIAFICTSGTASKVKKATIQPQYIRYE